MLKFTVHVWQGTMDSALGTLGAIENWLFHVLPVGKVPVEACDLLSLFEEQLLFWGTKDFGTLFLPIEFLLFVLLPIALFPAPILAMALFEVPEEVFFPEEPTPEMRALEMLPVLVSVDEA